MSGDLDVVVLRLDREPMLLEIDRCAQVAYASFLRSVREFVPPAAALQPDWDRMPELMKQAWRDSMRAALDLFATIDEATIELKKLLPNAAQP